MGHRARQVPAKAGTEGTWDMGGDRECCKVLLIPRSGGACGDAAQALG